MPKPPSQLSIVPGGRPAVVARPLLDSALDAIKELNERSLLALMQMAYIPSVPSLRLVELLRGSLCVADTRICRTAAELPFLMSEMRFREATIWQSWAVDFRRPFRFPGALGNFPPAIAIPLARNTLTLARAVTLHHPEHAAVLFGLSPQVSEVVASLTMSAIEQIADHQYFHFRPRWEDRPSVWRHLLAAAASTEEDELREFRMYGLQLLAGDYGGN